MSGRLLANSAQADQLLPRETLFGGAMVWDAGAWLWQTEYVDIGDAEGYALGVEYRSPANHHWTLGYSDFSPASGEAVAFNEGERLMMSWQKQWLHDALTFSLLMVEQRDHALYEGDNVTVMGQYQVSDLFKVTAALTLQHSEHELQRELALSLLFQPYSGFTQ